MQILGPESNLALLYCRWSYLHNCILETFHFYKHFRLNALVFFNANYETIPAGAQFTEHTKDKNILQILYHTKYWCSVII